MIEYTVKVDDAGNKSWCLNGDLHREDGPAIEMSSGTKEWHLNGLRHREDGPAIEYGSGTKKWFLNGVEYTESHFNVLTKPKELTINQIEELLGYKIKVIGNE